MFITSCYSKIIQESLSINPMFYGFNASFKITICFKWYASFPFNLFLYQTRESSLAPAGFLTAHFLQKTLFMKPLL
jgi:hypothetical protein